MSVQFKARWFEQAGEQKIPAVIGKGSAEGPKRDMASTTENA